MQGETLENSQVRAPGCKLAPNHMMPDFSLPTLSPLCRNSPQKDKHAEILFIDKMRSMELRQVRVTCYITWSPCQTCAQELAAFKRDRPDLVLHLYTSRLYFHWMRKYQKGLCSLWQSGIQLDVMDLPRKKGPQPPVGKGSQLREEEPWLGG